MMVINSGMVMTGAELNPYFLFQSSHSKLSIPYCPPLKFQLTMASAGIFL